MGGRHALSAVPGAWVAPVRQVFQRAMEAVVASLVASLALVVVLGVGFRQAGSALVWYDEVAAILLAWLTYYGAALVALTRGHIGVPMLVGRLRGSARAAVLIAAEAAVLVFFLVLAWAGWKVQSALAGATLVSLPAVPSAVAQSVIPIGAVLFIVAQLLSLPEVLGDDRGDAAQRRDGSAAGSAPDEGSGVR